MTAERVEPVHEHRTKIRFQDVDAAGIIFFARVFELFHDANLAFLDANGLSFAEVLSAKRWLSPLVHAEADYRAPMRFGDEVIVEVAAPELGESSMKVRYRVRSATRPELTLAVGHTVHVFVDGSTFRARPVPEEVRRLPHRARAARAE